MELNYHTDDLNISSHLIIVLPGKETTMSTPSGRNSLIPFPSQHRVFILTDITNEPDDAESFCRYLTYANQFKTEGVVAVTSVWLRNSVAPHKLQDIVDAYEKVVDNLNAHVHSDFPYPSAKSVSDVIKSGPPVSQSCHSCRCGG